MDKIVRAALVYRRAYWHYEQNEAEIANGGHDLGSKELHEEMIAAEDALDQALDERFGPGWDLMSMESLEKK